MGKKVFIQPLLKKRLNYNESIKMLKLSGIRSFNLVKSFFLNASMILPFIIDIFFNILHRDRISWSKA